MEQIIWSLIWLLINVQATHILLKYVEKERQAHQVLAALLRRTERELDILTRIYEDSGRRMEAVERERRLRWLALAEQLIVLKETRVRPPNLVIAQLFLTETDVEFLRARPSLAGVMGEACGAVASRWFYQSIGGIA